MYNMQTNEMEDMLLRSKVVPFDVHVWNPSVQVTLSHACEQHNGGCSHLCLLSPYPPGYSCACPIGVKLIDNFTCADGPQEMLLLARRTEMCLIYLDSPDYSYKRINVTGTNYTIGVDYDPVEEYFYWTDDEVMKIQRAKLDGSYQTQIISYEMQHLDGVAVDWVARNLYWVDPGMDRIEVATLNGRFRKIIINDGLYDPRCIAVAPELGWMFWSDWYDEDPKIERANLDGSERTTIVDTDLGWPNGIALDLETNKIYWCDARTHTIEYTDMNGLERMVLLNIDLPHPFGFTLMGDFLYWTDWQKRTIDKVHKTTGEIINSFILMILTEASW